MTVAVFMVDSTGAEYLNWGTMASKDEDRASGRGLADKGLGGTTTLGTGRDGCNRWFSSCWIDLARVWWDEPIFFLQSLMSLSLA